MQKNKFHIRSMAKNKSNKTHSWCTVYLKSALCSWDVKKNTHTHTVDEAY